MALVGQQCDRMDYLLRDSHHTGVAYGRFDHYRLIDTLRILAMPTADGAAEFGEPALGLEDGGLQSAEALMLVYRTRFLGHTFTLRGLA